MTPLVLVAVLGLIVAGAAGVAVFVMANSRVASAAAFHARCAEIGFEALQSPQPIFVACGADVRGRRVVLMLVERRSNGIALPPRVDVYAEAGLSAAAIPSGGALLSPGSTPSVNGTPPIRAAVNEALTPALTAAVTARLGGRFALSSWDALAPTAAMRSLVRARWPGDWRGLLVQTWVALDADGPTVRAAVDGLLEVRDVLARSPGITEAP